MNGKLKDLAMLSGFKNMKDLSEASNIPYSTILNYNKTSIDTWQHNAVRYLSRALKVSQKSFLQEINEPVRLPFIKWVGGKRQLLPKLIKYAPNHYNNYFEAFIGGGALLFKLSPKSAVINDSNSELINTWKVIRDYPDKLLPLLHYYETHDTKENYLKIRAVDRTGEIVRMSDVERAARFIYLNKGGYNGLWRVNSKGQNNVPYGGHKRLNLTPEFLKYDSDYLRENHIKIMNGDYKRTIREAKRGDFVYLDPPYIPVTLTSSFTSYTKGGFGLIQQQELAKQATKLANRGVKVMLSNSDVPLIKKLYSRDVFRIHHVKAGRAINSNGQKRGKVGEVIITSKNY